MRKLISFLLVCSLCFCLCGCVAAQDAPQEAGTLPPLSVTFFDCGKADSALLQADGLNLVIDTGTNKAGKHVRERLEAMGVEAIDVLVISHPHKDHVGGADILLDAFKVYTVLEGPLEVSSKQVDQYHRALADQGLTPQVLRAGDEFTLGELRVDVLGPTRTNHEDENDLSLVLLVTYGDTTFLFTGDAEKPALSDLMAASPDALRADVLKVPHHGGGEDNSSLFFDFVRPRVAVIPCERGTEDQLPDAARVIAPLEALGAQVFVTGDGEVRVTSDGKNIAAAQE